MKISPVFGKKSSPLPNESDEEEFPLICRECDLDFKDVKSVYKHLYHHIKQPFITLDRLPQQQVPPLKITLKNRDGNSFEIVNSPASSVTSDSGFCGFRSSSLSTTEDTKEGIELIPGAGEDSSQTSRGSNKDPFADIDATLDSELAQDENISSGKFSPNFADVNAAFLEEEDNDEDLPLAALFAKNAEKAASQENTSANRPDPIALPPPPPPGQNNKAGGENTSGTTAGVIALPPAGNNADYSNIPGAEPTPPPEPSPDHYPKLKVKTTGLFKDPEPQRCTITEITDDNPSGDPNVASNSGWNTPSSLDQDPLKLPDSDDNNLLSLFGNNDRAKEFGMQSSDNEFISLDRFDERNRGGAMQLYNSNNSMAITPTSNSNPLDSLTGLPMQALAQQVSRLQPNGPNGQMHQQNVLINIQQYSGPPQPQYPQGPPMYPPHYPPQPSPYQQPYQPYQPPNPMYYPPAPGYPPQPMGPPPPQMGQMQPPPPQMNQAPQMGGPQQQKPMGQHNQNQQMPGQMNQMPQQGGYRPPMPCGPRPNMAPRPQAPGQRMGGPAGPRAPQPRGTPTPRNRTPMGPGRPRGPGPQLLRGASQIRARAPGPNQNGIRPGQQTSPAKRTQEPMNNVQAKKKRMELLTPDKDDDDCQVICMQPKNTGLPQIESVSGGNQDSVENSIMHLSDSITLKPIPPKPKPKPVPAGDAKAVANILAARGITVSSTKNKESENSASPQKSNMPSMLGNGSVSIVAKNGNSPSKPADALPTVDLTDDPAPNMNKGLPFKCDLCPAQYPSANDLNKHRQSYHKTNGGMCELGVPLINIRQPGIMQKLAQLGIQNYIPLPTGDPNGMFALPIISTKNPGNVAALGSTQMLSLGPVRSLAKPQPNNNVVKQLNMNK